jgi:hypothetical protein
MTISANESRIILVIEELFIFQHYQVDVEDIKCPLQRWENHESMFCTIGFCIKEIFGIVGSQIEID